MGGQGLVAFFNKQEAFGLPAGTVRATIALVLVGGLLAALFMELDGEALTVLAGLAGSAVGFYFGTRNAVAE